LKKICLAVLVLFLSSCATNPHSEPPQATTLRTPSATADLSGDYLGEAFFNNRTGPKGGLPRPAMRMYLERAEGEADTYYGVLLEYDQLLSMGLPYIASQKAPIFNKVIGYLNNIATRISAYKFVPGSKAGTYEMRTLEVRNNQIVAAYTVSMVLNLDPKNSTTNPLAGATITGNSEGQIVFPSGEEKSGVLSSIGEALNLSQYKLAALIYKKGHLASTWRGNWKDLEGSYLSEYGRFKDGVLELYSQNGQSKAKFVKTNTTKAKSFTNPKSATIEGDYVVTEPIPKIYLLIPTNRAKTASDVEMSARLGLFLDVFDGSAPEAGSHLVTELAYTNPQDPEDFMMYYEHPEHVRNVGVEPRK
jgi:hypothetical protein